MVVVVVLLLLLLPSSLRTGDGWFSSPSSVRTTLAAVFAVVFALRAIPGGGDEKFNPLVPCYRDGRLLGFGDGAARAEQVSGGRGAVWYGTSGCPAGKGAGSNVSSLERSHSSRDSLF